MWELILLIIVVVFALFHKEILYYLFAIRQVIGEKIGGNDNKIEKTNAKINNKTSANNTSNSKPRIIHIAGASGSGKTTIGWRIIAKHPDITVYDLDDLYREFSRNNKDIEEYKKFIASKVNGTTVFVGLNSFPPGSNEYFDIDAVEKYYINISVEENLRRYFARDIKTYASNVQQINPYVMYDNINSNSNTTVTFIRNLLNVLDIGSNKGWIEEQHNYYENNPEYIKLTEEEILNKI